jgi:hypothetical protein
MYMHKEWRVCSLSLTIGGLTEPFFKAPVGYGEHLGNLRQIPLIIHVKRLS